VLAFAEWLQATPVSITIQSVGWIIPTLQAIHILMIGIVFVSVLTITLRILGRIRTDQPFAQVWNRFSRWMWRALVVMAITGLILIVGEPVREFTAFSFWLKMGLIAVGVAGTIAFRYSIPVAVRQGAADARFSLLNKCTAVGAVALWLVIIFLGRAIAYDVAVWGTLSPASGA
jgi:Family of unknown function (DUF6644)